MAIGTDYEDFINDNGRTPTTDELDLRLDQWDRWVKKRRRSQTI